MRDALTRVIREYPAARLQSYGKNVLAKFIRDELPKEIRLALGGKYHSLICEGSAGIGDWAAVPWGGVFDPLVTDSATKGYYIVYLFSAKTAEVFLSLNQGATAVTDEFGGRRGLEVLRDRAALMRARLSDHLEHFECHEIHLGSGLRLPRGYEAGHAMGKRYQLGDLPIDSILEADLQRLAKAYLSLTFRGGLGPTPDASDRGDISVGERGRPFSSITEVRQYNLHRRIDRNGTAAQKVKDRQGCRCKACDFLFDDMYGDLGKGFIEAHHRRPLSTLIEGAPVDYDIDDDFVVLCSNCHSMIHRTEDPSDIDGFKAIIESKRTV